MQKITDDIIKWLQQQIKSAGVNGLLVGVSGGLDSAAVAHLIKQASPEHSLGVILPLKSSPDSERDALRVLESCELKSMTVDLSETHDMMLSGIQHLLKQDNTLKDENQRLADANLRARLRMSTLYTLAANYNYLVVGTDNASEWYTGYFTKYGDGGVDLQPIADFTKGEVREMASLLGVPEDIVYKKPSADLWEGQTDEAEMGTTYDKIDTYLTDGEIPENDKTIIQKMHLRTEHKRHIPALYRRKDRSSLI